MDDRLRELLSGYIDGELSPDEMRRFEEELARNAELQKELEELRALKKVTDVMRYADLPEEVWENYWQSLYKKLERGIGWILLSVGAIIFLSFGLYNMFNDVYTDPLTPLWVKIGLPVLSTGAVILLVSFARERFFAYKRDRYKEVQR